jgi:aspartyl protease family protein
MINASNQAGPAMRVVIPVVIVSLVACVFAPRYAAQIMSAPDTATVVATAHSDTAPQSNVAASRAVVIAPSRGGHFRVEGRVDGRRISFMVDTGASVIALKAEDAATLGVRPAERDYAAMVRTANGAVVAPVELDTVEIEDLEVHNVAAVVLPPGAVNENLLGLSFLRRLRRFEYADGKLVLE